MSLIDLRRPVSLTLSSTCHAHRTLSPTCDACSLSLFHRRATRIALCHRLATLALSLRYFRLAAPFARRRRRRRSVETESGSPIVDVRVRLGDIVERLEEVRHLRIVALVIRREPHENLEHVAQLRQVLAEVNEERRRVSTSFPVVSFCFDRLRIQFHVLVLLQHRQLVLFELFHFHREYLLLRGRLLLDHDAT